MIPPHARIVLATQPIDFRKGPDGLAALVRDAGVDPFSGALYVFRAKRADRVKIIWWDGTGLCLFAARAGATQSSVSNISITRLAPVALATVWRNASARRFTSMAPCARICSAAADNAAASNLTQRDAPKGDAGPRRGWSRCRRRRKTLLTYRRRRTR